MQYGFLIVCLCLTFGFAGALAAIVRTNTWQGKEKFCHSCLTKNSPLLGDSEYVAREQVKFWLIAVDKNSFAKQNLHLY